MQMLYFWQKRRSTKLKIGEKEYSEIIVTDSEKNLLVSITDEDIIAEKDCNVVCVPVED